jgi:haloalkane dehalogenase
VSPASDVETLRTPEERFAELPGFPYEPRYRDWRGMRLAYLDEGEGPPVVLCHGEPSWAFLYRKVMGPLLEAGYRCVVPDQPGFGRSDKPAELDWYSYDNHTAALASLFEDLDLRDATIVVHDWGGPIGLRVATTELPDRVGRMVCMDTGVFTGHQQMPEGWHRFRAFVERTEDLPIGMLAERSCLRPMPPEVVAAYEAPFPDVRYKAGARAFPLFLPLTPDAPGARAGQAVLEALVRDSRPTLILWADSDRALPLDPVGRLVEQLFPHADGLHVIRDAGHFLQEDAGEEIGRRIVDWLGRP